MPKRIGIKQDNKNYVFTPGNGGSLIGRSLEKQRTGIELYSPKVRAKSILDPNLKKKRELLARSLTGY